MMLNMYCYKVAIYSDIYRKPRISGEVLKPYLPSIREIEMWHF